LAKLAAIFGGSSGLILVKVRIDQPCLNFFVCRGAS
jgi:hypothetical protein